MDHTFLDKYDKKSNFHDEVGDMIDTQPFYKWIQVNKSPPSNKYGKTAVVKDCGTEQEQDMYNRGAHNVLVDALILASISTGITVQPFFQKDLCLPKYRPHKDPFSFQIQT